jgi:hypothetical protein
VSWCTLCYGQGVRRDGARWKACECGKLATSKGMLKLAKQSQLDERLEELKKKGW